MKRSKFVAIGLLALSISACTKKQKHDDWNAQSSTPNYYIDNGRGYSQGGVSPYMLFWAYQMGANNRMTYYPTVVHQGYGRNGGFHMTSQGRTSSMSGSMSSRGPISRGSVSRGGFGSSGSHASS